MTFNEINNQAEFVKMGAHHLVQEDAVLVNEGDDIEKLMYTSAHHELVASALAVKACHEIDHDAMIGCMIGMNGVYPASPDPHDVLNAQKAMLQKYYYVEVQARGHYSPFLLLQPGRVMFRPIGIWNSHSAPALNNAFLPTPYIQSRESEEIHFPDRNYSGRLRCGRSYDEQIQARKIERSLGADKKA